MLKKLKRVFITPPIWLAASIFLIWEFIWDVTARLMARLGAIKAIHAVEIRISALPPYWAILVFLLPSTILIPAKLIGLNAIAHGHWLLGSLIFISAKIVGMALLSRIFNLTRPALLELTWFLRFYDWVMVYRNRIHAYLDNWPGYQRAKHQISSTLSMLKGKGRLLKFFRRAAKLKKSEKL